MPFELAIDCSQDPPAYRQTCSNIHAVGQLLASMVVYRTDVWCGSCLEAGLHRPMAGSPNTLRAPGCPATDVLQSTAGSSDLLGPRQGMAGWSQFLWVGSCRAPDRCTADSSALLGPLRAGQQSGWPLLGTHMALGNLLHSMLPQSVPQTNVLIAAVN